MRTYDINARTRAEQPTATVEATVTVAEIPAFLGRAYHDVAEFLAERGMQPAGPPFARHHRLAEATFRIEAGFPVAAPIESEGEEKGEVEGGVRGSSLPGGPTVVTVHVGPYEEMEPAYEAIARWIADHDGEAVGDSWEVYFDDPSVEPDPKAWRTEIFQPYRVTAAAPA